MGTIGGCKLSEQTAKLGLLLRALREDRGQDLVEYILLGGIVALGAIAGMRTLGTDLNVAFSNIATQLQTYTT